MKVLDPAVDFDNQSVNEHLPVKFDWIRSVTKCFSPIVISENEMRTPLLCFFGQRRLRRSLPLLLGRQLIR